MEKTAFPVKGTSQCLLNCFAAQELGLITLNVNLLDNGNKDQTQIVHEYAYMFQRLGKLKGYQVKLHIHKSVNTCDAATLEKSVPQAKEIGTES